MTQKRRRQSSTSNAPVPSAQSTNNSSIPENEAQVQDAELADLKIELAATKARCIEQETSIEDLKSRLSGLEKHVGSQLVLMQQSISKCVVVVLTTLSGARISTSRVELANICMLGRTVPINEGSSLV